MTWNELIYHLQSIPEDRREEQAVFYSEDDGQGYIIDAMERKNCLEDGIFDSNVGNDDFETFVLTQ